MLLGLCDIESKVAAAREPLQVDLTGGLGDVDLDMSELAAKAREEMTAEQPRTRPTRTSGTIRRAAVAAARLHVRTAAGVGRPRRRPGRPGGDRRWRRTRPVRLVADPLRDGGRQRAVGGRRARAGLDHRPDQVGGRPEAGLVRHRIRRPGRRGRAGRALPRHRRRARAASASSSTTARSTPITRRRCWCRCSSTRTSRSWCRRRPTPARSSSSTRSTRSSRRCRTAATGRSPARRAPRFACRARRSCRAPSARRSRPGSTRRCTASARTWPRSIDRVALWNIVATVDAFLSAGFTPAELMRWVHPSLVASTQGTGMGGMTSMQTMYHGNLLGPEQAERHPAGGPAECRCRRTSFSPTSAATAR